ncbi:MAG: hypothetical protein K6B44_08945, partial [Lachnospiraceae bacterium]|nr:hypothetical protein [Lachnospiraceae bacterium]
KKWTAKKGEIYKLVSEKTGTDGKIWYQIMDNEGNKGYIRYDFCEEIYISKQPEAEIKTEGQSSVKIISYAINVHHDADANSKKKWTAKKGEIYKLVSEKTGTDGKIWYQIMDNEGNKGYIRYDFCEEIDVSKRPEAEIKTEGQSSVKIVNYSVKVIQDVDTNTGEMWTAEKGDIYKLVSKKANKDGVICYQIMDNEGNKGYIRYFECEEIDD